MASIKTRELILEKQNRYIHQLPFSITRQISQNLDIDNSWQQLAAEIGYTHQQVRLFEKSAMVPGQSPCQIMLADWQAKNSTAKDLHDKLHKMSRRREMQILEAWFTSESEDYTSHGSVKRNNRHCNDDRSASQIQAALDNFDSHSLKPPGKDQRNGAMPKVEDANINLNRCNTFKDKGEMGSKHLEKGLILSKPLMKQFSKEVESDDKTIFCEVGTQGPGKSLDNMTGNSEMGKTTEPSKTPSASAKHSQDCSIDDVIALNGIHTFSYKEISQATDGFSDQQLIGQGAFGKVFHATLKNTKCAVKKLFCMEETSMSSQVENQIKREVANLSRYRHDNIVLLYGCMIDQSDAGTADVCLVYQFMSNGSLEDRLACKDNTIPLTWKQRIEILRGASCGIQFLHTLTDTPLIHGNIKSGNILLDNNLEAKISDLGMAHHATSGSETGMLTHITKNQTDTKQYHSRAYLPPEAQRGSKMSVKGDTYSFGVVIFETCTGEKAFDERREGTDAKFLVEYVQEMVGEKDDQFDSCDPKDCNIPKDVYNSLFKLGLLCTCKTKKGRLEMKQVFSNLQILENEYQQSTACKNEVPNISPLYANNPTSPHLAFMMSQFPPGSHVPESLALQLQYDQVLKTNQGTPSLAHTLNLDSMEKSYVPVAEIKDSKQEKEEDSNTHQESIVYGNDDDGGQPNNGFQQEEEGNLGTSQSPCYDSDQEKRELLEREKLRIERERKRLENLKFQVDDPEKKKEFTKSRDDFFARFEEQIKLPSGEESVLENETEDEELFENEEEHQQNNFIEGHFDEQCDSDQLFNGALECLELQDENTENESLDFYKQKYDTYQTIAREMSDENGKVVGELVDFEQRLERGEMSDSENQFSNNCECVENTKEDMSVNPPNMNIGSVDLSHNQLKEMNFPWKLQRRSEATESECYV